jgi:folate-dependent phosphoribosylglycinamide formyltransferase PurN
LPGIVLLIDKSDLSRIIYHALADTFTIDVVIREAKPSRSSLLRRRARKLGWPTVFGQIAFAACIVPLLRCEASMRRSELLQQYGLDESPIKNNVIDVPSINDPQTVGLLQEHSPHVIVVNGTRILDEAVLSATGAVFLNTHVGITPLYRGVHGGYWALASGHPEHFGVTIHKIDSGIDTGEIIAHGRLGPTSADNFCTYPLLQIAAAIPLLKQAVRDALKESLHTLPPPDGQSRLWTHPTALQYLRSRIALGIR